jgi:hypothetical protein
MPNAIEERQLDILVENNPPEDFDPTAVKILYTVYATTELLEELNEAVESGAIDPADPPEPITQGYIDALEDVIRCWNKIAERDDYEEFLQDVGTLDKPMLVELRGTVVYVGQHFGIGIDLPEVN